MPPLVRLSLIPFEGQEVLRVGLFNHVKTLSSDGIVSSRRVWTPLNSPLHRQVDDRVELPHQGSGSFADLDVVAVAEAGGGGRGAQLCLSASLRLLQGEQLGGWRADQQRLGPGQGVVS